MSILPGFVARHWQMKLSALAMAVLLWTVPRFEAPSEETLERVPVRVQRNDQGYALLGNPDPADIQVRLSGSTRGLLAVDRPAVWIPIDSVVSKDTTISLTFSMVRIPTGEEGVTLPISGVEGVTVEEMTPMSVRLIFEEIVDRSLVLVPRTRGDLPEGLSRAGPIQVTPEVARVSGPESRLEGMDSLPLIPLDLAQVQESGAYVQQADTSGLDLTNISPSQATLQVPVDSTVERVFRGLSYSVPTLDSGPRIQSSPAAVTVTLIGARSLVEAVAPDGLRVTVPLEVVSSLSPGTETRVDPVVVGVPPLVEAVVTPRVTLRRPAGL